MSLADFAATVRAHDGIDAFNEESRIAMADGLAARVQLVVTDGPEIVAAAFAVGDAPVELAVHPLHRRRGHATALLDRLLTAGESRFWAHGDAEGARRLATSSGLEPGRTLLRLSRQPTSPLESVAPPPGVVIRTFRTEDLPALLAVNGRAFADHPEQGALDVDGFERRARSPWFRPDGLFVAEQDGEVVGFHWTKMEGAVGEVYVLGVDPAAQGRGIAQALLTTGLDAMSTRGATAIELHVEGDNVGALALYRRFGFSEAMRDVLYVSRKPAAAGRAPA